MILLVLVSIVMVCIGSMPILFWLEDRKAARRREAWRYSTLIVPEEQSITVNWIKDGF